MSYAVVLQHTPNAGPGRIVPVFRDFGIPVDVRRLDKGDEVPTDLEAIRVLISLGGPMGVRDIGSPEYPFLAAEVELEGPAALLGPLARRAVKKGVDDNFTTLKQILEPAHP